MKQWRIKVVGKQRNEIDKHLVVQAVLALSRQFKEEKTVREPQFNPQEDKA